MGNVVLTGVPHSDGMSDEMLVEVEAWFDKGLREFGAELFEHSPERLWLYHAIVEVKKLRVATDQRRERIATAALQGLLADEDYRCSAEPKAIADLAIEYADALIAELDKEIEP